LGGMPSARIEDSPAINTRLINQSVTTTGLCNAASGT
jgi:hypothetical protein